MGATIEGEKVEEGHLCTCQFVVGCLVECGSGYWTRYGQQIETITNHRRNKSLIGCLALQRGNGLVVCGQVS